MRSFKINLPLILVWLTLTSTAPFIFYVWPGHPYKILTFAGLFMMIIFCLYKKTKRLIIDTNILIIIGTQLSYYGLVIAIYHNYTNLNLCIQFIALFILIMFIENFIGFERFVKSYINIILIMGIGGVIVFFVHLLIGLPPIFHIQYSETGITYFLGLTTSNDYYYVEGIRIVRYAGFFDEPGAFALFSIFAIVLNKAYFDNRKIEKYLIVVTVFTFSLAYFVIISLYLIIFYFKFSYLKYFILPVICIAFITHSLIQYKGENESIIHLKSITVDRFKVNKNRFIAGNNRQESSLHDKKLFLENPVLGVQVEGKVNGNNIFAILAKHGTVGFVFYYAFLVYLLILVLKLRGEQQLLFLKLLLVIVANFFHRPEFSAVFILLVIYSMIKYLSSFSNLKVSNYTIRY